MNGNLTAAVVEYLARLRGEHGFIVGPRELQEALRAIETVGVENRARVAAALRAICCSRAEEIEPLDRAFVAFFQPSRLGSRNRSTRRSAVRAQIGLGCSARQRTARQPRLHRSRRLCLRVKTWRKPGKCGEPGTARLRPLPKR